MNRLAEIKAAQAANNKEADAKEAPVGQALPVDSGMPVNRLQAIKQQQLKAAAETGENPYESMPPREFSPASIYSLQDVQSLLALDLGKVANEKTLADKNRVKQSLLPQYLPFVDDYVEQGHNYPNDVAVQIMVWLLDIGEIEHGLDIALVLVAQNQKMPKRFDRDMATFLADFFYDWAGVLLKDEQSASPYLDVVVATAERDQWAMHPLCMSKLYAMLAKHKERTQDYKEALELCEKAEAVNPGKAGVKGLTERVKLALTHQT